MTVCKTANAGISWETRSFPGYEGNYSTYCEAVAVAPGDASIVYAGGQLDGNPKVFRSTNAGTTWADVTDNLATMLLRYHTVYAIWVSPYDPGMVLAGTSGGVFRWAAFGRGQNRTWTPTAIAHPTQDFAYDQARGILYAATYRGVFATDDAGGSWRELNDGLGCLETLCIDLDSQNGLLFVGTNGGSVWRLETTPTDLVAQ
jgi:photosystem II stability/assembly factor-like uncharacterized protein